jgi:hypothetical protein
MKALSRHDEVRFVVREELEEVFLSFFCLPKDLFSYLQIGQKGYDGTFSTSDHCCMPKDARQESVVLFGE